MNRNDNENENENQNFSRKGRILFIVVVLLAAWILFLANVKQPPLEETPVLIMVWVSVVLIILAAFPEILKSLKRIKVSDFEIELQESVEKSSAKNAENLIQFDDLNTRALLSKGDFRVLASIIERHLESRERTINLIVNLQARISVFMLFTYLYFLNMVGITVNVLFTDKDRRKSILLERDIIGAICGSKVKNEITFRYPLVLRVLNDLLFDIHHEWPDSMRSNPLRFNEVILDAVRRMNERPQFRDFDEILSREMVESWFAGMLNSKVISSTFSNQDKKTLRRALASEDDYVIVVENDVVKSLLPICDYTGELTKKVLSRESSN